MNVLILVPSKYEIKLLPSVHSYQQYNDDIYKFFFFDNIYAFVGITGIGNSNVELFFKRLNLENQYMFDVILSVGTCGFAGDTKKINRGDVYISDKLIHKKNVYKVDLKIISDYLMREQWLHIGSSLTMDDYFIDNKSVQHSSFSVDMEGSHVYRHCNLLRKNFLNVRIISDFCCLSEHTNRIEIENRIINRYQSVILEIVKILKEI